MTSDSNRTGYLEAEVFVFIFIVVKRQGGHWSAVGKSLCVEPLYLLSAGQGFRSSHVGDPDAVQATSLGLTNS